MRGLGVVGAGRRGLVARWVVCASVSRARSGKT